VVPFADLEELVTNSGLPSGSLSEVGTDYRLADPQSLVKWRRSLPRRFCTVLFTRLGFLGNSALVSCWYRHV
jgi:hypothetical protein